MSLTVKISKMIMIIKTVVFHPQS